MADTNQTSAQKTAEMKSELNRSSSGEPLPDPKSIQDLTQYVRIRIFTPKRIISKALTPHLIIFQVLIFRIKHFNIKNFILCRNKFSLRNFVAHDAFDPNPVKNFG